MVGITERDAANHAAIVGQLEVPADQSGMPRQGGLRNGAEPERLRCQHEVGDIGAAMYRAVKAELLVVVNDRHMRRTEEVVVLQRLLRVGHLVASDDAE